MKYAPCSALLLAALLALPTSNLLAVDVIHSPHELSIHYQVPFLNNN